MKTFAALLCLGLLVVEPATAQKVYSLTVSVHQDARPALTEEKVDQILTAASRLLSQTNSCGVTLERKGPITTFADAPSVISDETDLEAVHRENADIKVVRDVQFCKNPGSFVGCSWRRDGPKTMIVTQKMPSIAHIIWAHEFGHTTGLQHRTGMNALMSACNLFFNTVQINKDECDCFLAGPGGCSIPDSNLACPTD